MPEFREGSTASYKRTITEADVVEFADLTGDDNPVHLDERYAHATRFGRRIVHGMLVASMVATVIGRKLPGSGAIYVSQSLRFLAPVYLGDTVTARATLTAYDRDRGRMTLDTVCTKQDGTQVLAGEASILYRPVEIEEEMAS